MARLKQRSIHRRLGLKNSILFIHVFINGCDTSAVFRKGKLSCFKLFKKHTDLQDVADVFNSSTSSRNAVVEAANRCFLKLYSAPAKETFLNLHRYHSFSQYPMPNQIFLWCHQWKEQPNSSSSEYTTRCRFCKCTTGCGGGKCGCRKRSMNCTTIYHNCHVLTLDEVNEEVDLEPVLEATDEDVNPESSKSAVDKPVSRPSHQRKKQRI
ncbi:hypothetical protein PR048_009908, partial [Dryococelus australis]